MFTLKLNRVRTLLKFNKAGKQKMHNGSDRQARMIKKTESQDVFEFSWEETSIIRTTNGKVKCKFAKLASESKLETGIKTNPSVTNALKGIFEIKALEWLNTVTIQSAITKVAIIKFTIVTFSIGK